MKKNIFLLISLVICSGRLNAQTPSDKEATARTQHLYENLMTMMNNGNVMFGHQDDLAYGIGWRDVKGESDVKRTVGEYPAVFGWDIGQIEMDSANQIDGIPFEKLHAYIKAAYKMGAVNTVSWHLRNPANGKSAWDTAGRPVSTILPNGVNHDKYIKWLDKVADFALSLKSGFWGKKIPFIFRPYHENTGSWFWWGEKLATPDEFVALWRMTVDHLRARGAHNILYAYSPDEFRSKEHYLACYPGDDYVDILGHDLYHKNIQSPASVDRFIRLLNTNLGILNEIGKEHNKVVAITESGAESIPFSNWWTEIVGQGIKDQKLSYFLVWRNGNPKHYYAPHPDNISAGDFKKFYADAKLVFSKKVKALRLYTSKIVSNAVKNNNKP